MMSICYQDDLYPDCGARRKKLCSQALTEWLSRCLRNLKYEGFISPSQQIDRGSVKWFKYGIYALWLKFSYAQPAPFNHHPLFVNIQLLVFCRPFSLKLTNLFLFFFPVQLVIWLIRQSVGCVINKITPYPWERLSERKQELSFALTWGLQIR